MLFRPIHHTFAPLGDSTQCGLAFKRTWMPWRYRSHRDVQALEKALGDKFKAEAVTFASGREALLALLHALHLQPDEAVIVQGYTCVVVPNAIRAAGMTTIYADIDQETLNLNLEETEKAITPKTRAIICQHTFGIPANTAALRQLCDSHSLILIEDCAHVIPDKEGPREIGTYGDAILLSFGRDKAISGVAGGAIVTRDKSMSMELRKMQDGARSVPLLQIFALLQYPLLYAIARALYGIKIGKALLVLAAKLRLLIPILTRHEKEGDMRKDLHKMPGACAALALQQLQKLETINSHRRSLTKLYIEESKKRAWPILNSEFLILNSVLPLQKFPMFALGAEKIRRKLKQQNIHLYDGWTGCVVCPAAVDPAETGYEAGLDPEAEKVCMQILSLPTHPGMTEAQAHTLCALLDPLLKHYSQNQ